MLSDSRCKDSHTSRIKLGIAGRSMSAKKDRRFIRDQEVCFGLLVDCLFEH
jgi:hypothetical protein